MRRPTKRTPAKKRKPPVLDTLAAELRRAVARYDELAEDNPDAVAIVGECALDARAARIRLRPFITALYVAWREAYPEEPVPSSFKFAAFKVYAE